MHSFLPSKNLMFNSPQRGRLLSKKLIFMSLDFQRKMEKPEQICHVTSFINLGLDIHQRLLDIKITSIAIQIKEPQFAIIPIKVDH